MEQDPRLPASNGGIIEPGELLAIVAHRLGAPQAAPTAGPDEPLDALVAIVLAYRTVPENAHAAAAALRARYATWSALAAAPVAEVAETIRPAGLCQQRARFIQRLVRRVLADFPDGSLAPLRQTDDLAVLAYLRSLPGVGSFGAQWVLLTAFERPAFPVAWPARRVLVRLGVLARAEHHPVFGTDNGWPLDRATYRRFHAALVEHAHHICLPRQPRCLRCPLTDLCPHFQLRVQRSLLLTSHPRRERRLGRRPRVLGPASTIRH